MCADIATDVYATLQLVLARLEAGEFAEAEYLLWRILASDDSNPDAVHLLGMVWLRTGRVEEGLRLLGRAIELDPTAAHYHNNLGGALGRLGRASEALPHLSRAISLKQDYGDAYQNLSVILPMLGMHDDAAKAREVAAALLLPPAQARRRRASVLVAQGRIDEAIEFYRAAIAAQPEFPEAYADLAKAYMEQGRAKEGCECFRAAVQLDPTRANTHSDLVHSIHYDPGVPAATWLEEAVGWSRRHAAVPEGLVKRHHNDRNPERRLRIGFVSADFNDHPVARLMRPVLGHCDRNQFEMVCYSDVRKPDADTLRLRGLADLWRDVGNVSDSDLAALIQRDAVDILVDLGGHMGGNRLPMFALRPAPVQVTHFSYPDTTGVAAIGYRITDTIAEPPGWAENRHSESLVHLPDCAWCYDPGECPAETPLPAHSNGSITFAALNKPMKHSPACIELWSQILREVPGSRIMLLGYDPRGENRAIRAAYETRGVRPDQLLFFTRRSRREYLELYQHADLALDPFPYNGGVTSCDALWMGLPLVALAGETYIARQGLMLLTHVGLPDFIATTPEEYVRCAVRAAANLSRLSVLRSELRQRLANSPLMDWRRFARHLEMAYRQMWQRWCVGAAEASPFSLPQEAVAGVSDE
jgi:predicted O-linked N-acetylglucosamine transferase (SPINDLY family)